MSRGRLLSITQLAPPTNAVAALPLDTTTPSAPLFPTPPVPFVPGRIPPTYINVLNVRPRLDGYDPMSVLNAETALMPTKMTQPTLHSTPNAPPAWKS